MRLRKRPAVEAEVVHGAGGIIAGWMAYKMPHSFLARPHSQLEITHFLSAAILTLLPVLSAHCMCSVGKMKHNLLLTPDDLFPKKRPENVFRILI